MAERERTTLLWINKSSSSSNLTHSIDAEASEISTFVQRRTQEAQRATQNRRPTARHDWVAFHATEPKLGDHTLPKHKRPKASACRTKQVLHRQSDAPLIATENTTPSTHNIFFSSRFDPFDSAVVPVTADLYALIIYARNSILVGAGDCKIEVFKPSMQPFVGLYQAASDFILANVLRYKHVLYTLLACYSQRLRCRKQFPFSALYDPDQYFRDALSTLRGAVSSGVTSNEWANTLAISIHLMIFCTSMSHRIAESRVHVGAFLRLLPNINTTTPCEYWLLHSATSLDIINAAHSGDSPIIRDTLCDPGNMLTARQAQFEVKLQDLRRDPDFSRLSSFELGKNDILQPERTYMRFNLLQFPKADLDLDMGAALTTALHNGQMHPKLILVTSKVLACLDVAKVIWNADDFANRQDCEWLCRRTKAVLYELLTLQPVFDGATKNLRDCKAKCLLLTLIVYVTGAYHRMLHLSREALVKRLKAAIRELTRHEDYASRPHSHADASMCLWIFMTGFWASHQMESRAWYKGLVTDAARNLGLHTPQALHKSMNKYLWSNTVQQYTLYEVAECLTEQAE